MLLYAAALSRLVARREDGQTMAEYAVILTVIAAAVLGALLILSGNITGVLHSVADAI
jgi:Flp pilus assembly pilin Flp